MLQGTVLINKHSYVVRWLNLTHIAHEKLPHSAPEDPSPWTVTNLKLTITATWTSTGASITEGTVLFLSLSPSLVIEELKIEDTWKANKRIGFIHVMCVSLAEMTREPQRGSQSWGHINKREGTSGGSHKAKEGFEW